ncbi:hypothetical protein [Cellulomonas denverensis]|uniref:Uncharacterized protein n=1 Tax=Cellulomonas denverensis TaxID=264297 RepID=A0A7X6QZS8_9CELL|nr:hypothetical protein [Cellulomonas denverensis]NKY23574.1 hypothetical protein [Cellulomonas denverensis]
MKMTLDEFRQRAVVPRLAGSIAAVVGGILLLLLLYNARSAWESMDANPWASFWDLFWVTTGENGSTSPVLVALVWGPVVLLPVILVLVVVDLLTHEGRVDKVYQRYLQDGWVAEQLPTGVRVKVGRNQVDVVVLSGPGQPPAELAGPAASVGARVAAMDKKQRRAWEAAVARQVQDGFPVGDLMPELPPRVLACARRGKSSQAIVVGGESLAILAVKPAPAPVTA